MKSQTLLGPIPDGVANPTVAEIEALFGPAPEGLIDQIFVDPRDGSRHLVRYEKTIYVSFDPPAPRPD